LHSLLSKIGRRVQYLSLLLILQTTDLLFSGIDHPGELVLYQRNNHSLIIIIIIIIIQRQLVRRRNMA